MKKKKTNNGPPCVKCGDTAGWTGPTYRPAKETVVNTPTSATAFGRVTVSTEECLIWECKQCGYRRHEPCITSPQQGEPNVTR